MQTSTIVIGTRSSELALWQAHYTRDILLENGFEVQLKIIKTKGDELLNLNFNKINNKGIFTDEIEQALLSKSIDLAVHLYEDLPITPTSGLLIAGCSERENPADWLIIRKTAVDRFSELRLKHKAVVGAVSARQIAQFAALRPDVILKNISGNITARLSRLNNDCDAVLLEATGLNHLNLSKILSNFEIVELKPHQLVPAPAQGVFAWQIREDDIEMEKIVRQHLNNFKTEIVTLAERHLLRKLDGDNKKPIGIYINNDFLSDYHLWASVADSQADFPFQIKITNPDPEKLLLHAVATLKNPAQQTIFISRDININKDEGYFARAAKAFRHTVYAQSLIDFLPLPYQLPDAPFDWLFFSNVQDVQYFFAQEPNISGKKIGVVGLGTLRALWRAGFEADFVGNEAPPEQIALSFTNCVNDDGTVLFPQAINSIETLPQLIATTIKVLPLPVYSIIKKTNLVLIPKHQIAILTTPLNAQVYCQNYDICAPNKVITIDETTAHALQEIGFTNAIVAAYPDEISLVNLCYL